MNEIDWKKKYPRPVTRGACRVIYENLDEPTRGAEIGVFKGQTSKALLELFPGLELLCVDPWKGYTNDGSGTVVPSDATGERMFAETKASLHPFRDRVQILRISSVEAGLRVGDGTLDFAFIDANHAEEHAREDIQTWLPKIRPGGLLLGDDYGMSEFGVTEAVDDLLPEASNIGRTWLIRVMRPQAWIASFPRSGNSWIRQLLAYILHGAETMEEAMQFMDEGSSSVQKTVHHERLSQMEEKPGFDPSSPVVYAVRDPKDVFASYRRYMAKEYPNRPILSAQSLGRLKQLGLGTDWVGHVQGWLRHENLHVVRYEDLHQDTAGELRKICQFLDLPTDRVEESVNVCQFDRLKKRSPDRMLWKGEIGSWKGELSPSLVREIESECGAVMGELGYETVTPSSQRVQKPTSDPTVVTVMSYESGPGVGMCALWMYLLRRSNPDAKVYVYTEGASEGLLDYLLINGARVVETDLGTSELQAEGLPRSRCYSRYSIRHKHGPHILLDADAFVLADLHPLWSLHRDRPFIAIRHQPIPGHVLGKVDRPFLNGGMQLVGDPSFVTFEDIIDARQRFGRPDIPGEDQAVIQLLLEERGYEWEHPEAGPEWNAWLGATQVRWPGKGEFELHSTVGPTLERADQSFRVRIVHGWSIGMRGWFQHHALWQHLHELVQLDLDRCGVSLPDPERSK